VVNWRRSLDNQFITLTVGTCVQHDGPEALHHAGMSAAAETCQRSLKDIAENTTVTVITNVHYAKI